MPIDAPLPGALEESHRDRDGRCPACLGERSQLFGQKNGYPLWECQGCGALFTRAWAGTSGPEGEDIKALYDHYYDGARFELHPATAASYERLVRSLDRHRSTGRWLDLGYGEGGLLEIAARHGWSCYGSEISPGALQFGGERGWIVSAEPERDPRFPQGGFDVVTMIECLEHVIDPRHVLASAARFLRPGGALHLTTPNARSLNRRLLGLRWSIISPPEHLTLYTRRALRNACLTAGLRRPVVRCAGFNPFDLKSALVRRTTETGNSSRNAMGQGLNEAFSKSGFRRQVKNAINFGLNLAGWGDGLKAWAERPREASGSGAHHG